VARGAIKGACDGAGTVATRGAGMGGYAAVDGAGAMAAHGAGEAEVVNTARRARGPMSGTQASNSDKKSNSLAGRGVEDMGKEVSSKTCHEMRTRLVDRSKHR
jgi:hypothetical protein